MSLVFAGITPHPIVLIPSIGKEATLELEKTRHALMALEKELYTTRPQRIILITPHEGVFEDAFVVNGHNTLSSNFEKFGDMATKYTWNGAPELAAKIQHKTRQHNINTRVVSNELIGHGASVPLAYLTAHQKEVKILPVGYSAETPAAHIAFGEALKEVIFESDKRIAVIASGDMSHTLMTQSPGGYHESGDWFDTEIRRILRSGRLTDLVDLDPEKIEQADQCLYRSLLILSGVLKDIGHTYAPIEYEAPFGVGYLTAHFVLS